MGVYIGMLGVHISEFSKLQLQNIKNTYYKLLENGWAPHAENVDKEFIVARQVRYRRSKSDYVAQSFVYYGYDTKEALIKYIDLSNNNLFEYCKDDIRNLYMDLDNRKKDNPATPEEVEAMIATLIVDVNNELVQDVTRNQVIVTVNSDYVSKKICSIHIVMPTITMRTMEMKSLVTTLNVTREFVDKLDEAVYNKKSQLFRFYKQSKLNLKDGSNKYTSVGLGTAYTTDQTFITSYVNHNLINYRLPEPELILLNKKIEELGPSAEVSLSEDTILNVALWMDKLNTDFYTSHDWIQVLYLLMKLATQNASYSETDRKAMIKLFESHSRTIADNEIYNEDENYKQINGFVIGNVRGGATKLVRLLNRYCDEYYFTFCAMFEKDKALLQEWITKENLDINISTMREVGRNIAQHKLTLDNARYKIDLRNGMVYDKQTKTLHNFKLSSNIIIPKIFKEVSVERLVDNDANVDDTWHDLLIEYLEDNETRDLFNRADWGCGKSRGIMMPIIEWVIKNHPDWSICVPSTHTSLNNKLQDDLTALGFVSHLNAEREELRASKYVIISTQSICHLEGKTFDVCIFDEVCNLTSQLSGNNFTKELGTPNECYKVMNYLRKNAEKNIHMDADLNHELVQMITTHSHDENRNFKKTIIHDVKDNKFKDYKYKICREEDTFTSLILEAIGNNKKIFIASATKSYLDNLVVTIEKRFPTYNTVAISSAGVHRTYAEGDAKLLRDDDKSEYIKNINDKLLSENVYCLGITPTIVVGTSINHAIFDIGFVYTCPLTLSAEQSCQHGMRVRTLNDKLVYMCLPSKTKCWSNFNHLSKEQVEYNIKNKVEHYTQIGAYYDKIRYKVDEFFLQTIIYNEWMKRNSENSFANEFVGVLNRHNLNWELMAEAKDKQAIDETQEDKDALQEQLQNDFDNSKVLDCFELAKLKKKMKDKTKTDIITEAEYLQHTKSQLCFALKNIIIDETHINKKIELLEHKKVNLECEDNTTRRGGLNLKDGIINLIDNLNYLPCDDNINCAVFKYNEKWCGKDNERERLLSAVRGEEVGYKLTHHLNCVYETIEELDEFAKRKKLVVPIGIPDLRGCCKTIKQIQHIRKAKTQWNNTQQNRIFTKTSEAEPNQEIQSITQVDNRLNIHSKIVAILNFRYEKMVITNRQFKIIISKHPEEIWTILNLVAEDIKYNEVESNSIKELLLSYGVLNDFNSKKITKLVYHTFKAQLQNYDIKMEYCGNDKCNAHTTRDRDKMVIEPKNSVAVYDKLVLEEPIIKYDSTDLLDYDTYKIINDKFGKIPNDRMAEHLTNYDNLNRAKLPKTIRKQHKIIIEGLDLELQSTGSFLLRREHELNGNAICSYFLKDDFTLRGCFNTIKSLKHRRERFADWVCNNGFYSKLLKKAYESNEKFKHTTIGDINELDVTIKRDKLFYKKTKIELYETLISSKWIETDGVYTRTMQTQNYRTYPIIVPIQCSIKMTEHEQKAMIKAELRECHRFNKPQVIIKQDIPNMNFLTNLKYENMIPYKYIDAVDVVEEEEEEEVIEYEFDNEDGNDGYIKKPEVSVSYYDRTTQHIDDIEAERTKKRNETLAYLSLTN
tara:strand:+ start:1550 stop:6319 length:4770 start_codon:yes stop_codon:yes gene_type:complete